MFFPEFFKLVSGVVQPRLDRAAGNSKRPAYLSNAEMLEIIQAQHHFLLNVKLLK